MHGARSSVDRVLASEARGRWFDPSRARHRPLTLSPRRFVATAALMAGALLAGCSTTPGTRPGADGPPPRGSDAPDLQSLRNQPDAEPKLEPIRSGGPNKPYEVLGQNYVPMTGDQPLVERGLASWYGRKFHGRRTASGETYNMFAMTAAHKTMPIPSYARVRNPSNGREVIVRVNDRGPFSKGRVIDLSYAAAVKLGVQNGVAPVEVERITYEEIRAGLGTRTPVLAQAAPPAEPEPLPAPVPAPAAEPPPVAEAALPSKAHTTAASGFWLQLGAFGQGSGAYSFQQRLSQELDWLSPLLTVFSENGLFRLQAGPYASRDQAREAAERVRTALALVPMIIERR